MPGHGGGGGGALNATVGRGRLLLRVDALFLIVSGCFGLAADLASYRAGAGPFGAVFLDDPTVIGVVEAHGLAVLTGIAVWAVGARTGGRYWHWHLALTHALLGGANAAFFAVFEQVGARTGGIAVTAVHFAFVVAQIAAAFRKVDPGSSPG